jgi:hypothetical protein
MNDLISLASGGSPSQGESSGGGGGLFGNIIGGLFGKK